MLVLSEAGSHLALEGDSKYCICCPRKLRARGSMFSGVCGQKARCQCSPDARLYVYLGAEKKGDTHFFAVATAPPNRAKDQVVLQCRMR